MYCNDNEAGETQDEGCPGSKENDNTMKMCMPKENASDGSNNGTEISGTECRKCQDDAAGDGQDSGCGKDGEGDDKLICVVDGAFNKDVVTNKYGNECARCYDDAEGFDVDTGCDATSPICSD